jgi:hypothetical protein
MARPHRRPNGGRSSMGSPKAVCNTHPERASRLLAGTSSRGEGRTRAEGSGAARTDSSHLEAARSRAQRLHGVTPRHGPVAIGSSLATLRPSKPHQAAREGPLRAHRLRRAVGGGRLQCGHRAGRASLVAVLRAGLPSPRSASAARGPGSLRASSGGSPCSWCPCWRSGGWAGPARRLRRC